MIGVRQRFNLKRRWNILHAHHRRCRQSQHQLFLHPFVCFLTTMALSFIGYVLFFSSDCCSHRCGRTRTENPYRSSPILMFDTGAFLLVSIQLPRQSSFRTVRRLPALCHKHPSDGLTPSSLLYGYRIAKVSLSAAACYKKR